MNVKVIHVKMVEPALTWKMDICVHVNLDLLDLNVKQVIGSKTSEGLTEKKNINLTCEVIDLVGIKYRYWLK